MSTTIPIVIVNYNRLTYLKKCILSLNKTGYHDIYIIDNKSTYQPLLDFYSDNKHVYKIFHAPKNFGHNVLDLWNDASLQKIKNNYYVYTDSDIEISSETPIGFIEQFIDAQRHFNCTKIGTALKIDDLPDHYSKKNDVIKWETKFWSHKHIFNNNVFYKAPIDTTFALVKPRAKSAWTDSSYRAGGIYAARHLPWYEDSNNLPEDIKNYYLTMTNGINHW